jgi:hydrogenase nickel incorporation protein HypA/HybF
MHEASVAMSVIEIAERHCRDAGYSKVSSIDLRIGKGSGVLPDALEMAFDIVKLETMAAEAVLNIEAIPLGGKCRACGETFTTDDQFILACPSCQATDLCLEQGREMDIIEIEVD